jgi:SAM-dependent methyltransferase
LQDFLKSARGTSPRVVYGSERGKFGSIWPSYDDVVFAIHGDVSDPNSLVILRDDYDRLTADAGYLQAIERLLQSHYLIFLGYGLSSGDSYLINYLESVGIRLRGNTGPHFVFEKRKETPEEQLRFEYLRLSRKKFGLRYIVYEQHEDLAGLLMTISSMAQESKQLIDKIDQITLSSRDIERGSQVSLDEEKLAECYSAVSIWLKSKGDFDQRWVERFAVGDFAGYSWRELLEGPSKLPKQIRSGNIKIAETVWEWFDAKKRKNLRILELGIGYLTTLGAIFEAENYAVPGIEVKSPISKLFESDVDISYTGVDLNVHAIDHGRKKLLNPPYKRFFKTGTSPLLVHGSSVEYLRKNTEKYDLVIASFTLHHCTINHRRAVYLNILNCLTEGGLVVIADPTGFSSFNRQRIFSDPEVSVVEFPVPAEVDVLENLFSDTGWWSLVDHREKPGIVIAEQSDAEKIKSSWYSPSFYGYVFKGIKETAG